MRSKTIWIFANIILLSVPVIASGAEYIGSLPLKKNINHAQQRQEVYLSFNYENLVNRVVVAQYEEGQFFLPVSELLTALGIPHQVSVAPPVVNGSYLNSENRFQLDFSRHTASLASKGEFEYSASEMFIGELDYYVTPEVLEQVFDLSFSIDFNNLLLKLETPHTLPVVAEFNRARNRERQNRYSLQQEYYPLRYGRDRKWFSGGFLDYSLTANASDGEYLFSYNLNLGAEILGGDLQGSAFGSYSENVSNYVTDDLRWRYVIRDSRVLSQFYIGQTTTDGIESRRFLGIRATNDPIEPRYIFEEFEIEGEAQPGSEVELYFDEALYDYQEIDQNGRYRFLAPLTYGSSRLRLKIYDPAGGVRERARRIQVPFSFLKTGEFNYHLNAGRLQDPLFGSTIEGYLAQGDVGYGISNWLTQKFGVEYYSEFTDELPQFYSTTSARVFKEYLLNIDAAPQAFYRVSGSAIYPSSASWDLEYTYFTDDSRLYNTLGSDYEINGSFYLPLTFLGNTASFRLIGNHTAKDGMDQTRYRADLNTRFGRLNLRFSYRDTEVGSFDLSPSLESEIGTSITYFVGRSPSLPGFVRGLFLRGQVDYNPNLEELVQAEGQISRDIFQNGRIQASYSRNFLGDFDILSFGITFDFNKTRSSSSYRRSQSGTFISQNFLGSIGYDQYGKDIVLSNRQQVGRAASSVRLFVDNNNNSTYDEGDEPIEDNAVRIGRSGVTQTAGEGIVRLSQLQAYNQVNMEINKSLIRNPMIIPEVEQFSIVTDPNQYKPIEIPFYRSGIISGRVTRPGADNRMEPVSGLRVYLEADSSAYIEEMRTFNDGSFYAYEIPPGPYRIYIDRQQLEILDAVSDPDTLRVTVEPKAEGDFIEDLSFNLRPKGAPAKVTTLATASADSGLYQVQISSFVLYTNAVQFAEQAEKRYNQPFVIKNNPKRILYSVRTRPISGLRAAIQQLLSMQENRRNPPALVVLNRNSLITDNGDNTYSVQIGAFSTRNRAERFKRISENELDIDLRIALDPKDELYKVRTTGIQNSGQAERRLAEIRNKALFSDAFIPPDAPVIYEGIDFEYQVRLGGISAESDKAFLSRITDQGGLPDADISSGPQTNVALFNNIPTWRQAIEIRDKLSELSTDSKPVIMLREKSN